METQTLSVQSLNPGASTSGISSQAGSTIDSETAAETQSEAEDRLQTVQRYVHPFLSRSPEDAYFVPEALKRYIDQNKIYGVSDDVK
jgi:hypothetical protein